MKRGSQYQDKSVQDWAVHLKYLQFILIEFDPDCAPEEDTMIWYLQKDLWPLMQVRIEQHGRELDSFDEIIEKAINTKAKATFRPCSYTRNTN